jgi:hypothetical protein
LSKANEDLKLDCLVHRCELSTQDVNIINILQATQIAVLIFG